MQKRLAAGEVVFLDAELERFVQSAANRVEVKESECVVVRAATDEAMRAGEIAERAGDLEPEVVEMRQFDFWRIRIFDHGKLHTRPFSELRPGRPPDCSPGRVFEAGDRGCEAMIALEGRRSLPGLKFRRPSGPSRSPMPPTPA